MKETPEAIRGRVLALRAQRDPDTNEPLSYDVIRQRSGISKTTVAKIVREDHRRRLEAGESPRFRQPHYRRRTPVPPIDDAASA